MAVANEVTTGEIVRGSWIQRKKRKGTKKCIDRGIRIDTKRHTR